MVVFSSDGRNMFGVSTIPYRQPTDDLSPRNATIFDMDTVLIKWEIASDGSYNNAASDAVVTRVTHESITWEFEIPESWTLDLSSISYIGDFWDDYDLPALWLILE